MTRLGQLQENVQKKSWFSNWWGGSTNADQKDLSDTTAISKLCHINYKIKQTYFVKFDLNSIKCFARDGQIDIDGL